MFRDRALVVDLRQKPLARRLRIRHGFERRKGLGGNDKQRFCRVEITRGFGKIRSVHVRYETKCKVTGAIIFQRLVHHHRYESLPPMPILTTFLDAFSGPRPSTRRAATRLRKALILWSSVHLRDNVNAIHKNLFVPRARNAAWKPRIFRDIDLVAAKHRITFFRHPTFTRQRPGCQCAIWNNRNPQTLRVKRDVRPPRGSFAKSSRRWVSRICRWCASSDTREFR